MYTHFTKEEKNKPVLLFLHGWGCDGSIFLPVARKIRYSYYLIDLWGFGKSQGLPDDGWSVWQYADQLNAFCLEQNLNGVVIVGHSFGCRVATVFAEKYPEKVVGMVFCSGAGLKRFSAKRLLANTANKIKRKFGKKACGSVDYERASLPMKRTLVKAVNCNLTDVARQIKCPVLLIWGKNDTETPLWMGKKFHRIIADSSLLVWEGGHFTALEKPLLLARVIDCFVGGLN